MHDFMWRKDALYCEGVPVDRAVKRFGTPLYLYSYQTLVDHFRKLRYACASRRVLICYSVKANSNLTVLKTLVREGAGLDVVSGGELLRAKKAGVASEKIVYAGVGKTESEVTRAIRMGIHSLNVESYEELKTIDRVAGRLGKTASVSLRINPDVSAGTHAFITTGLSHTKFGIDFATARGILLRRHTLRHVSIDGLHLHIGSQIVKSDPFVRSVDKTLAFIRQMERAGVVLRRLNIGGGLGIIYKDEHPQTAAEYAQAIFSTIGRADLELIIEPGRFIVGNAGILLAKVLYLKKTPVKQFVIVDAGMNDLIRPALYDAYHAITPIRRTAHAEEILSDVVGPVCESADFLGKDRRLGRVRQGDIIAVMGAGAYGFSMASNYNSRPRACEVMVQGSKMFCIRERETFADLIDRERMLSL